MDTNAYREIMDHMTFTTELDEETVRDKSAKVVELIRTPTLSTKVEDAANLNEVAPKEIDEPYPLVVLLNGPSHSGKSTFVDLVRKHISEGDVYELTTVGPVYDWAETIIHTVNTDIARLTNGHLDTKTAAAHREEKTDAYRAMMHDLKMLWQGWLDGPNLHAIANLVTVITNNQQYTVDRQTREIVRRAEPLPKNTMPAMVFINARERENLDSLKLYLTGLGLVHLTLYVNDGATMKDRESFANADGYEYDITISNVGTLDDLSVSAFMFSMFANRANHRYGASKSYADMVRYQRTKESYRVELEKEREAAVRQAAAEVYTSTFPGSNDNGAAGVSNAASIPGSTITAIAEAAAHPGSLDAGSDSLTAQRGTTSV